MLLPIFKPTKVINKLLKSNTLKFNIDDLFLEHAKNNILEITKTAIYKFLLEYKDSTETLKLYVKEIERLMLWCNIEAKLDLLEINRESIIKYQEFLQNPKNQKLWCGNKVPKLLKNDLVNPDWRPCYKHLSTTSVKKILKIIDSFFNYLVQINFLPGNPLAINRRRNKDHSLSKIVDRYLELDEINFTLEALTKHATETKNFFLVARAKYIILLLFYTGIRISEAAKHTMGNLIQRENNWFLAIVGKGKKYREIPVPDELLDTLSDFRKQIGLTYLPEFKEVTPLIPNINLKQNLTSRRIDQILKWAFNLGAKTLSKNYPHKASKLKLASAHWLRHSYVTYLLNNGAPLKVAQENAGHSDIGTTMLYRHVNQIDRHKATRNLSLRSKIDNED